MGRSARAGISVLLRVHWQCISAPADRSFPTPEAEAAALIYNYPAVYTAAQTSFEQVRRLLEFGCVTAG